MTNKEATAQEEAAEQEFLAKQVTPAVAVPGEPSASLQHSHPEVGAGPANTRLFQLGSNPNRNKQWVDQATAAAAGYTNWV